MNQESFDFQSLSEQEEQLDFDKLIPCPHCKKPILQDAGMCYYCGRDAIVYKKPRWVVWVAIIVVIAFALLMLLP